MEPLPDVVIQLDDNAFINVAEIASISKFDLSKAIETELRNRFEKGSFVLKVLYRGRPTIEYYLYNREDAIDLAIEKYKTIVGLVDARLPKEKEGDDAQQKPS